MTWVALPGACWDLIAKYWCRYILKYGYWQVTIDLAKLRACVRSLRVVTLYSIIPFRLLHPGSLRVVTVRSPPMQWALSMAPSTAEHVLDLVVDHWCFMHPTRVLIPFNLTHLLAEITNLKLEKDLRDQRVDISYGNRAVAQVLKSDTPSYSTIL